MIGDGRLEIAMEVRRASLDDLPAIEWLMGQLAQAAHGQVAPGLADRVADLLGRAECGLWVAEVAGRAVGLISASSYPTLWHAGPSVIIDELVVEASQRGQGVGRALIGKVVEWARANGASEVEVSTELDNQAAQDFYARCGFTYRALLLEMEFE